MPFHPLPPDSSLSSHSFLSSSLRFVVLMVAALLAGFAPQADAQTPAEAPVVFEVGSPVLTERIAPAQLGVMELRRIELRADALSSEADALAIPLLDGIPRRALRTSVERRGPRDFTWRGRFQNVSSAGMGGRVVLTSRDGALAGALFAEDGIYEIFLLPDGTPALGRLYTDSLPEGAEPIEPGFSAPLALRDEAAVGQDEGQLLAERAEPLVIDLLSVYTPQARNAAGGDAGISATIQAAVDAANTAFIDSDVDIRFRLVHTALAGHNDSGNASSDLNWVTTDPSVAALRDAYGADLVSLITESGGGYCGVGWVMRNPGSSFASSAFQMTARSCAVGNLSFAHEHGHNMGLEHDPANGIGSSSASYPWSFGHYVSGSYRTVMSYSSQCTSSCPRVPHWSNPAVSHNGYVSGITNQRDNHRTLNLVAGIVAAFRPTVVTGGGGGGALFTDGFESGGTSAWSASAP